MPEGNCDQSPPKRKKQAENIWVGLVEKAADGRAGGIHAKPISGAHDVVRLRTDEQADSNVVTDPNCYFVRECQQ